MQLVNIGFGNIVQDGLGLVGQQCEIRPIQRDIHAFMPKLTIAGPLETVTIIYAQGGDIGVQTPQHQDRAPGA